MAKIKVSLSRRNASKREKLVTGFVIMNALVFLWIEGTSGALQPDLTSVESWGETQIKVMWQPFEPVDSDKPHVYELYIDDYLEYFGNDVMYMARRLTPDTMYHFKLRSCIQDTHVCSPFSKTLSGTTAHSRKRGFTESFIQWTIICLVITIFAGTTAAIGAKITRRLWRSFLYRYDYRSETNLQFPKYVASTDAIDEDIMSSLCLKTLPQTAVNKIKLPPDWKYKELEDIKENEMKTDGKEFNNCVKSEESSKRKENAQGHDQSKEHPTDEENKFKMLNEANECSNHKDNSNSMDPESKTIHSSVAESMEDFGISETTKNKCVTKNENNITNQLLWQKADLSIIKTDVSANNEELSAGNELTERQTCICSTDISTVEINCVLLNNHKNKSRKVSEGIGIPKVPCSQLNSEEEHFTKTRAHSFPKLTKDLGSRRKNKGHRRALSLDSNIPNKKQHERSEKCKNLKEIKHHAVPQSKLTGLAHDLVIVVDNSNIFIGAQECATLLYANERKRHIRVKIQQLVKVFQRGRVVSRAFVQGSSPPTTEQVWEVYRRLGYCVDLEDRRGKDEQRVDEGLHLHMYKALFELSPRTLVIASGDGNKGKSECATSLPGCAQAAIARGWHVEVHSWQHATSMEWLKLAKKYPDQLAIHYLDRYLNYITFVDGKHGRKCEPFPADVFKNSTDCLS